MGPFKATALVRGPQLRNSLFFFAPASSTYVFLFRQDRTGPEWDIVECTEKDVEAGYGVDTNKRLPGQGNVDVEVCRGYS